MFKKSLQSLFCILPQPAFYSQSAVCILHSVCILPPVRSLQSAVRSLRFTLTACKLKFEISATRNCKRVTAVCGLRFAVCGLPDAKGL